MEPFRRAASATGKTFEDNSYVYFQPYQGIVVQFSSNNLPISIEVFDASGRLMAFEKLNSSTNKYSISSSINWAKGVYYFILKELAWSGINVIEVVSTSNEFTIVVKEKDSSVCFDVLRKIGK